MNSHSMTWKCSRTSMEGSGDL